MTQEFNLWHEPWIECVNTDITKNTYSLTDIFAQAHNIKAINGESAPQDVAILRLLLAIMYDLYRDECGNGEDSVDFWAETFERGGFNAADFEQYRDQYQDRFDLLDEKAPFFQIGDLALVKGGYLPLSDFIPEVMSLEEKSNDMKQKRVVFTGYVADDNMVVSYPEAARWLLYVQSFDISGIKRPCVGDTRASAGKVYGKTTVCADGGFTVIVGDNLFETLMLNFIATVDIPADDIPFWVRSIADVDITRIADFPINGPISLLVCPNRGVRLHVTEAGVDGLVLTMGATNYSESPVGYELMSGFAYSSKYSSYLLRGFEANKSTWRGLQALIAPEIEQVTVKNASGDKIAKFIRAKVLDWITDLRYEHEVLPENYVAHILCVGVVYGEQHGIVDGVVVDTLNLHTNALKQSDSVQRTVILEAVDLAEKTVKMLTDFAVRTEYAAGNIFKDKKTSTTVQVVNDRSYTAMGIVFSRWINLLNTEPEFLPQAKQYWVDFLKKLSREIHDEIISTMSVACFTGTKFDGRFYDAGINELNYSKQFDKLFSPAKSK